jgi:hypothetical protein
MQGPASARVRRKNEAFLAADVAAMIHRHAAVIMVKTKRMQQLWKSVRTASHTHTHTHTHMHTCTHAHICARTHLACQGPRGRRSSHKQRATIHEERLQRFY